MPGPGTITYRGKSVFETVTELESEMGGVVTFTFYSLTNATGDMLRPGAATALAVPLPFRGSIIGMTVQASVACSGIYTVELGGTAQVPAVSLNAGTVDYEAWARGTHGFSAGSSLTVTATGVATSAVVEVVVYVTQDPTTIL